MSKTVREIAAEAAAVIEFHGHAKWTLLDQATGHMCLRGAAIHAIATDDVAHRYSSWSEMCSSYSSAADYDLEMDVITACSALAGDFAIRWNNRPERTADEVVHLLKRVANGEHEQMT